MVPLYRDNQYEFIVCNTIPIAAIVPTFSFKSASLSGRPGRLGAGTAAESAEFESAIVWDE